MSEVRGQKNKLKTGLAIFYSSDFLLHKAPVGHPENANRLIVIINALKQISYFGIPVIEPRQATEKELLLVHTQQHVEAVRQASNTSNHLDPDTYTSPGSYKAALRAAGALVEAVEGVSQGKIDRAFCLVRPPGHHAAAGKAMGFCLFNNAAIAAAWVVNNLKKKVVILDFDAHHGNGTQEIFYDTDKVLYCSWHQWPHYPGTGRQDEAGAGKGKGYTLNIPLDAGSSDEIFLNSLDEKVMPRLKDFDPYLIIVSAGYDSHRDDPLSLLQFTEDGYARFFAQILNFCQQNGTALISCLEGGYDSHSLSSSVLKSLAVLADKKAEL